MIKMESQAIFQFKIFYFISPWSRLVQAVKAAKAGALLVFSTLRFAVVSWL